jgi:diphthamide biosynthesis protein 4
MTLEKETDGATSNDAYYTLSDKTRRRDYDDARKFHTGSTFTFDDSADEEEVPRPPPQAGATPSWFNMFGFGRGGDNQESQFADQQFESAFEEMMHEDELADENHAPTKRFWTIVGGISGGAMGFIFGDVVGMVPGAIAGSKAGAIRDAKGKSVYKVFQSLDQGQKARILSELAAKLFSGAIS